MRPLRTRTEKNALNLRLDGLTGRTKNCHSVMMINTLFHTTTSLVLAEVETPTPTLSVCRTVLEQNTEYLIFLVQLQQLTPSMHSATMTSLPFLGSLYTSMIDSQYNTAGERSPLSLRYNLAAGNNSIIAALIPKWITLGRKSAQTSTGRGPHWLQLARPCQ